MDYWLPEFRPSPPSSDEPTSLPSLGKRDRWVKKTMEVDATDPDSAGFHLSVQVVSDATSSNRPRCTCPVCLLMHEASVRSSKEIQEQFKNIAVVDHGKQQFTMYDRTRPWQRQHVHNCTDPRPLARRMPPATMSRNEAVNRMYLMKMLHPGKIMQAPKKSVKKLMWSTLTGKSILLKHE